MDAAAFKGTFSDVKTVKTRKVVQFLFEVPLEKADHALDCLGGLPRPDKEVWVAIARLAESTPQSGDDKGGKKRAFHELPLSQQAALKCGDEPFQDWLRTRFHRVWTEANRENDGVSDTAANVVRELCGVFSRAELDKQPTAGKRWADLHARFLTETGRIPEMRS